MVMIATVARLADYRGLETRGLRPDPLTRNGFARYVYETLEAELRRMDARVIPMAVHEVFWGVPCGPTESMLPGRGPRGIMASP